MSYIKVDWKLQFFTEQRSVVSNQDSFGVNIPRQNDMFSFSHFEFHPIWTMFKWSQTFWRKLIDIYG